MKQVERLSEQPGSSPSGGTGSVCVPLSLTRLR